jgi:hypothetical protein
MQRSFLFHRFFFEPKFSKLSYFSVENAISLELLSAFGVKIFILLSVLLNKLSRLDFVLFHKDIGSESENIEGLKAPFVKEVFLLAKEVLFGCGLGSDSLCLGELCIVFVVLDVGHGYFLNFSKVCNYLSLLDELFLTDKNYLQSLSNLFNFSEAFLFVYTFVHHLLLNT